MVKREESVLFFCFRSPSRTCFAFPVDFTHIPPAAHAAFQGRESWEATGWHETIVTEGFWIGGLGRCMDTAERCWRLPARERPTAAEGLVLEGEEDEHDRRRSTPKYLLCNAAELEVASF